MQEIRTITLDKEILDAIASNDDERLEDLEDELSNCDDLESLLGCYHESGEVSYSIEYLEVDKDGNGHMDVNYTAHKYSACRDIILDEDDSMTVAINIDMPTGKMTLTGIETPDRDPDTY